MFKSLSIFVCVYVCVCVFKLSWMLDLYIWMDGYVLGEG